MIGGKQVKLYNNTFVYNDVAVQIERDSGNPGIVKLTNNIFAHNNEAVNLIDTHPSPIDADIAYNLFFDNSSDIFASYSYMYNEENNRYGFDPLFVNDVEDEDGDYHILETTLAVNGGDPDFDNDGTTYQSDEDDQDPDGTRMDIGAYYFDSPSDFIPQRPRGFYASGNPGENVNLHWQLNIENDIAGYKISRRLTDTQSDYVLIATVNANTTSFTDTEIIVASGGNKFSPKACYKLSAIDLANQESSKTSPKCKPYKVFKTVSDENQLPEKYTLYHAYPNPFNPVTKIKFGLPEKSSIQLVVYDLLGREIVTLKSGTADAGWYPIQWGGYNNHGTKVPSGIYIYTLTAESLESNKTFVETKKMVLLK